MNETNRKILLITGAGGFLWWWLCREAVREWRVHGAFNTHIISSDKVAAHACDLADSDQISALLDRVRPDAVIHAAAVASPEVCQRHPEETRKINVDASRYLAVLCAHAGVPLVFTSTDLVFDGRKAPYSESDPPSPVNVYGEQKAAAEAAVLAAHPDAAVCRLPLLFGFSGGSRDGFDHHIVTSLRQGIPVRLFTDEFRTPADPVSVARGLLLAVSKMRGVYHLGGRLRLSRYDTGRRLAELFGLDTALLMPVGHASAESAAPRAADVSLNSDRAYDLGYEPMDMATAYRFMADVSGDKSKINSKHHPSSPPSVEEDLGGF